MLYSAWTIHHCVVCEGSKSYFTPVEAEPILNPSFSSRWTWRWGSVYLTAAKDQPFRIQSRLTPSLDSVLPATDSGHSVRQDCDDSVWMSQQTSPSLTEGFLFLLSHPLHYSPSCCFLNSWFCGCFYGWRTLFCHRKSQPRTLTQFLTPLDSNCKCDWWRKLWNMRALLGEYSDFLGFLQLRL